MKFCGNCGTRLPDAPDGVQGKRPDTRPITLAQQLGAMVGADLSERFRQAGLEASGQRRNVTILFADLSGFTNLSTHTDSEDLYNFIQEFVTILANNVYKYEGMVDKFTGDGIMALFGAPIMHENNAELAIRAALDMQDDVAELSRQLKDKLGTELHLHIGLHCGTVIVGGIGSDLLMNYTAIGDTVNLAQRLDSVAASGDILVSESVYTKTKALFNFDAVPDLILKGYTEPITGYRVRTARSRPGSTRGIEGLRAPMIGRDSELNRLKQITGALAAYRQGQMVMIVGEAGLGKSRLVSEVKGLSQNLPVSILEGFSLTYRRSVSYWIFLDIIRHLLGVTIETPIPQISQALSNKVKELMGNRIKDVLPYLEHMLSLPPTDAVAARRIEYLDAGQLRQQIFLAVRDLLVAESHRQPLILILEDLHWADEASLGLINFLVASSLHAPLLLVSVTRPFKEGSLQQIANLAQQLLSDRFHLIELQNLSTEQSIRLLERLLAVPNLPETLRDQIVQRAAGIPLYIEEILRMLIDAKVVQRENAQWHFTENVDLTTLGVPETLQGLILTRFDRLAPAERRVLQVASVIGRQFSVPVLKQALNMESESIDTALDTLVSREFLLPPESGAVSEHAFKHVLVSDAIYGTLLKRERSELHGQVGSVIEAVYADRLDEQVDLLARHFSWSPQKDKALLYLGLAAQKAARSHINDQARQYYEEAIGLLPEVNHDAYQALQLHAGLGDVLVLVGEYPDARTHFQRSIEELACEDPASCISERSIIVRKIGETYERQGDYDQALICLAQAQEILAASTTLPAEKALVLNDIGWIHFRRGDFDDAEKALLEALNLALSASRYDITASIYNRLGGIYYAKDQFEQATGYVRKSLVLREELGDIVGVARSYNNLGLLKWRKGDWDQALEDFSRSLELNHILGDIEGLVHLHSNMGLLLTDRGKLEQARVHLEQSLEGAQKIGHAYLEGLAHAHLSHYWLAVGEWQTTIDYCLQSIEILGLIGSKEVWVDLYVSMGEAYLGLGNVEYASDSCNKALELHREQNPDKQGPSIEEGRILRLRGNIARAQGDYEKAADYLRQSSEHFAGIDNHLELGRTSAARAILAQESGNAIEAGICANEARFIFRQLHADMELQRMEKMIQK
jgi:predicted ATPase/class 3 adenylate cyclase